MFSKTADPARAWPLARRLVALYAITTISLVTAVAAFLYFGLSRGLDDTDDHLLRERVQVIRRLLRAGDWQRFELKWEVESELGGIDSPQFYLRILDKKRTAMLETPGMTQLLPLEEVPGPVGGGESGVDVATRSGREFRVLAAPVEAGGSGEPHVIQVAVDITPEEAVLRRYRHWLALLLAGVVVISLGLGYSITRRGMQPLEEIAETTRRIRSSTLSERVRLPGLPAELASLADHLNQMLERLEQAFTRLSRFAADLAHELRTPVNNLRGEAEVALSKPRTAEEYREVLASSLEEYLNLSNTIDGLLFVASAEQPEVSIQRERVDLMAELGAIVEFYEPIAAENAVTLRLSPRGELWFDVERVLFRRAVSNLISNAIAYTPPGGTISLSAVEQSGEVLIEVADTGIGISAEELPHVFDRFYRVRTARRRSSRGVGLGLSIVKTVMDLHNGSANIESESGAGTRVTLVFPRAANSELDRSLVQLTA